MERKCAIYNRISVENKTQLEKMRNTLIEYCKNILDIKDYVLFEDVGSVEGKRKEFEDMIDRIHKEEFTDLLVYHPNRIYRAEYNKEKFDNIINDIDKYVDIYNPVQLRYDKRTKVNPIPKTMNFGLSKGLTFNRVLIYPTKPMLDWLSGKSKDMKDESLSKFYVAVTRARYSVAFVYKTKRLPTNDIGTKWTPNVL